MENIKENTDLMKILDCMSGVDGGVSYVKLRFFLEDIEDNFSEEAMLVKDAIRTVSNTIRILERS